MNKNDNSSSSNNQRDVKISKLPTCIKNDSGSNVNYNKQGSITTKGVSINNSKKD